MPTGKIEKKRLPQDNYQTPTWAIEAFVPYLKQIVRNPREILDPGAGNGNIGRVMRSAYPKSSISGIEKRNLRAKTIIEPYNVYMKKTDFLSWAQYFDLGLIFDLTIMNPPYKLAQEFIVRSMELSRIVVALLKLDYLASQGRADWMRWHTPAVYVIPRRPSFTPDGETDWHNYGWFVWSGYNSKKIIEPRITILDLKEKA